jgi:UDP:flavonoid glycosyltransferase YjiC (YdhE family)
LSSPDIDATVTRFDADTPRERLGLAAEAILAHRKRDSDRATFEAEAAVLAFDHGRFTFSVTDEQRSRLDDLLGEYPVFKVAQPETRKADSGTVYVSAVTDPKHAADFVEAAFRSVYELPEDYRLWVAAV